MKISRLALTLIILFVAVWPLGTVYISAKDCRDSNTFRKSVSQLFDRTMQPPLDRAVTRKDVDQVNEIQNFIDDYHKTLAPKSCVV